MTSLRTSTVHQTLAMAAAGLLSMSFAAQSAMADNPSPGAARDAGPRSGEIAGERSGSSKTPARKSTKKQLDRPGNFISEIIDNIRARSVELCARYGSREDCLEEAEVCLTMVDVEDNQIRLCLNTAPRGDADDGTTRRSRVRQNP